MFDLKNLIFFSWKLQHPYFRRFFPRDTRIMDPSQLQVWLTADEQSRLLPTVAPAYHMMMQTRSEQPLELNQVAVMGKWLDKVINQWMVPLYMKYGFCLSVFSGLPQWTVLEKLKFAMAPPVPRLAPHLPGIKPPPVDLQEQLMARQLLHAMKSYTNSTNNRSTPRPCVLAVPCESAFMKKFMDDTKLQMPKNAAQDFFVVDGPTDVLAFSQILATRLHFPLTAFVNLLEPVVDDKAFNYMLPKQTSLQFQGHGQQQQPQPQAQPQQMVHMVQMGGGGNGMSDS